MLHKLNFVVSSSMFVFSITSVITVSEGFRVASITVGLVKVFGGGL